MNLVFAVFTDEACKSWWYDATPSQPHRALGIPLKK